MTTTSDARLCRYLSIYFWRDLAPSLCLPTLDVHCTSAPYQNLLD